MFDGRENTEQFLTIGNPFRGIKENECIRIIIITEERKKKEAT